MAKLNNLYPHLLPDDIKIWERFIELFGDTFINFDYDVRVGDGRDPGENVPDNIRKMALDLSQRRIDVVAYSTTTIFCVEVTVSAGLKAIGQLEAYPILYNKKFAPAQRVVPLLVAQTIQSDMITVLNEKGIDYVEISLQ